MKKQPHNFIVDEADIEIVYYNDNFEDIFSNESIINAANKVFDFNENKRKQAVDFDWCKGQQLENEINGAETINYVDEINLNNVRENKNAKLVAKKIIQKYKKLSRKRKQIKKPTIVTVEGFRNPSKKIKKTTKSALITARNIAKKYQNLRHQ